MVSTEWPARLSIAVILASWVESTALFSFGLPSMKRMFTAYPCFANCFIVVASLVCTHHHNFPSSFCTAVLSRVDTRGVVNLPVAAKKCRAVQTGERLRESLSACFGFKDHAGDHLDEQAINHAHDERGDKHFCLTKLWRFGCQKSAKSQRPPWFFQQQAVGGILTDIGSHQIEQFLYYVGAQDARVTGSRVANYHHSRYPELEDFGEANLVADNGATNYFRVDWFTPDGLGTWGDGRTFILGTDGYIELRKYIDVARHAEGDHVYLVNDRGEQHVHVKGQVGFPYFSDLILDGLNRTDTAMSQAHTFKAAELCLLAQQQAERIA